MSFEEEFPSLKVWWVDKCDRCGTAKELHHEPVPVLNLEDVQEHCLDKQKVKEEIDKMVEGDYTHSMWVEFAKQLKKRLGL